MLRYVRAGSEIVSDLRTSEDPFWNLPLINGLRCSQIRRKPHARSSATQYLVCYKIEHEVNERCACCTSICSCCAYAVVTLDLGRSLKRSASLYRSGSSTTNIRCSHCDYKLSCVGSSPAPCCGYCNGCLHGIFWFTLVGIVHVANKCFEHPIQ